MAGFNPFLSSCISSFLLFYLSALIALLRTSTVVYLAVMDAQIQPEPSENPGLAHSHLEQAQDQPTSSSLPPGWERKIGDNGQIYFVNHQDRTTTFRHPVTGEGEPNLKFAEGTGRPFWVDHVNKTTRWANNDEEWDRREGRPENAMTGNDA